MAQVLENKALDQLPMDASRAFRDGMEPRRIIRQMELQLRIPHSCLSRGCYHRNARSLYCLVSQARLYTISLGIAGSLPSRRWVGLIVSLEG